jgi:hypothetical protein
MLRTLPPTALVATDQSHPVREIATEAVVFVAQCPARKHFHIRQPPMLFFLLLLRVPTEARDAWRQG